MSLKGFLNARRALGHHGYLRIELLYASSALWACVTKESLREYTCFFTDGFTGTERQTALRRDAQPSWKRFHSTQNCAFGAESTRGPRAQCSWVLSDGILNVRCSMVTLDLTSEVNSEALYSLVGKPRMHQDPVLKGNSEIQKGSGKSAVQRAQ